VAALLGVSPAITSTSARRARRGGTVGTASAALGGARSRQRPDPADLDVVAALLGVSPAITSTSACVDRSR